MQIDSANVAGSVLLKCYRLLDPMNQLGASTYQEMRTHNLAMQETFTCAYVLALTAGTVVRSALRHDGPPDRRSASGAGLAFATVHLVPQLEGT